MATRLGALGMLLMALCSGCASTSASLQTAVASADTAHPVVTKGWLETRLYFGLGPVDDPSRGVSEAAWREFLDHEVTPRFPTGLTVVDVYGQWQDPGAVQPERLRSREVLIEHPDTAANREAIEAIRNAWKRRTGDRSVMRVTHPVDVSF